MIEESLAVLLSEIESKVEIEKGLKIEEKQYFTIRYTFFDAVDQCYIEHSCSCLNPINGMFAIYDKVNLTNIKSVH